MRPQDMTQITWIVSVEVVIRYGEEMTMNLKELKYQNSVSMKAWKK
jgi:hypothetical protein